MSTIAAGTTSGTALVTSGDTTGQLVLQTNGTTTAVTIGTNQVVTLAQPLPVASGGTGATSLTANNVLLGNGTSAVQVVAPGASGNILTSNGTTWQSTAPAGGGSMILLQTVTGSGVDTIDVTGNFTSTYRFYKLYVTGTFSVSTEFYYRMYINGSLNTSAVYGRANVIFGGSGIAFDTGSSQGYIIPGVGGTVCSTEITISNPSQVDSRNPIYFVALNSNGAAVSGAYGYGYNAATGSAGQRALTGLRITTVGTNGTWVANLYGIKE